MEIVVSITPHQLKQPEHDAVYSLRPVAEVRAPLSCVTPPTVPDGQAVSSPQSRSGRCGEEEHPLPLPGIEPRFMGRQANNLVTVPIMLSKDEKVNRCN
jgi:hypothetical protein